MLVHKTFSQRQSLDTSFSIIFSFFLPPYLFPHHDELRQPDEITMNLRILTATAIVNMAAGFGIQVSLIGEHMLVMRMAQCQTRGKWHVTC